MTPIKLTLFAYKDDKFIVPLDFFLMQVNPATIRKSKQIEYADSGTNGSKDNPVYDKQATDTLSFETILDDTGVVPGIPFSLTSRVENLEEMLYTINKETHEPNYVMILWGSLAFYGCLHSLRYEYTLFNPSGVPLRVKIEFEFKGYQRNIITLLSSDLSRRITVKAGESIPALCNEYYDAPAYCSDIARANHLPGFRHVQPGTTLMFPSLQRNDNSTSTY